MSHSDQTPGTTPVFPDVLRFGCPACQQELSIPGTLAGVEGPCPHCRTGIAAPIPATQQPARVLQAQPNPAPPPPVAPPPAGEAIPVPPVAPSASARTGVPSETRHVLCQACGCELAIEPMSPLPYPTYAPSGTMTHMSGRWIPTRRGGMKWVC